jgi:isocitrate lyase
MVRGASNIARVASQRLVNRQWTSRRAMAQDASPSGLTSLLASDAFQLLAEENKSAAAEDELFETHVRAMTEWWRSPRFAGIKRPYTAESVVARRGTLQQMYPSSLMARKLFDLLEKRATAGLPVHIRKAFDSIQRRS